MALIIFFIISLDFLNIVHYNKYEHRSEGNNMTETEKTKNHIIEITTALIKEFNGDMSKITSRLIAERAGIGLGSINYFFGSKDRLIAECVQRDIGKMLAGFAPDVTDTAKDDGLSDQERLISWARQTFDFLFENQAVASISILSDLQNYLADSNSVYTQRGFTYAIRSRRQAEAKKLPAFILVSAMQAAFLARNNAKEIVGYDLFSKSERDLFISDTVNMLFYGLNHDEGAAHEK